MGKIKVGVVGVGNCFSGLVQGMEYYKRNKTKKLGLMHEKIGGYGIEDIEFVSAFDVGKNKIGKPLSEAIFADPNYVKWVDTVSFCDNTVVKESPILDGVGVYVASMIKPIKQDKTPDQLEKEAIEEIKNTGAKILINYLPVGSQKATEFWANVALKTNCAFINCLPYFEKVPVVVNDCFRTMKIGDLIKEYSKDEKKTKFNGENATISNPSKDIFVFSFDPTTFKIKLSKIKKFIKKKGTRKILKITSQRGRRVFVDLNHLMLVWGENGIATKMAHQLKEGDYLPIVKNIPISLKPIKEFDLIDEFSNKKYKNQIFVMGDIDDLLYSPELKRSLKKMHFKQGYLKTLRKRKYIPLSLYLNIEKDKKRRRKLFLRYRKGRKKLPALFPLNIQLLRLIGFYLAEGYLGGNGNQITFSLHKKEFKIVDELTSIVHLLINDKIKVLPDKENSIECVISNKLFVLFLSDVLKLKKGAKNKEVPYFVFSLSNSQVSELLDAYFLGDGSSFLASKKIKSPIISATTACETLAMNIQLLLLRLGIDSSINEKDVSSDHLPKFVKPRKKYYKRYTIRIQGRESFEDTRAFESILGTRELKGKTGLRRGGQGIPVFSRIPSFMVSPGDISMSLSRHSPAYLISHHEYFDVQRISPVSESAKKFINGDVHTAKIIKIEEIDYNDDVFDFEVEETHNFLHGFGIFSHNCMPVFIASDKVWEKKFKNKKLPVVGDDIKGVIGATITHRTLAKLCVDRGAVIDRTYQINVGGNTDFANMLERERLESKKISKTEAVQSLIPDGLKLKDKDIYIGPSDFIPFLGNTKLAFIRIEGRMYANIPFNMEVRLEVDDKANSGGIAIDAIRCAQLALDKGIGGNLTYASAYLMKHPPVQMGDEEARKKLDEWISEVGK